MNIYHITFGSGHLCSLGLHYHLTIKAPNEYLARLIANRVTDGKWSSIYDEKFQYPDRYNTKNLGTLTYTNHEEKLNEIYWSTSK